jgi:ATP-dependent Clp protease ATP-binding subunit ClpA
VEGLALRIAEGNVPESLKKVHMYFGSGSVAGRSWRQR